MKELSKNEKYAMKFFKNNGFKYSIKKQYISKTLFEVEKDNLKYEFEVPSIVVDIKQYMSMFLFCHKQKLEIAYLKGQLNE